MCPGQWVGFFSPVSRGSLDYELKKSDHRIAVVDLATGQRKTLIPGGSHAEYFEPVPGEAGYLVYAAAGTLRAVRFDPVRLEVLGDPVSVVEQVLTKANGTANFSVSRTGAVAYVAGGVAVTPVRTLLWVDRQGREESIPAPPRTYAWPRLSPDGSQIALDVRDQDSDVWVWDFRQATLRRFTFEPDFDGYPVWTPDGRRLIFMSGRSRPQSIYGQQADGTGSVQSLLKGPRDIAAYSLTPDGEQLVVREGRLRAYDLSLVHLNGTPRAEPLLHGSFNESNGEVSPDGRWLAYQSNESGQDEIYVRPFPNVTGGRWQVSSGGGQPAWARSGRELFYIDSTTQALMSVAVQTSPAISSGTPVRLFDTRPYLLARREPLVRCLRGWREVSDDQERRCDGGSRLHTNIHGHDGRPQLVRGTEGARAGDQVNGAAT